MRNKTAPELLAPAGSFTSLTAAIKAGADAVYFGIQGMNMRSGAKVDFSLEDMHVLVKQCHDHDVKAYLALNTIIYENETGQIDHILTEAKKAEVDAVIAWDMHVLAKAKAKGLELHLSTQASVANYEALKMYAALGVTRVVLARELDLKQIKTIKTRIEEEKLGIELEVFIHGAMCISVSGRCFMSQIAYCKSANRGECIQPCRRSYKITDEEEGTEYVLDNNFVMSPKDLCTMPIMDKLIDAGIDVFKIEGRARKPEYVKTVVESYRESIELHKKGELTSKKKEAFIKKMEQVYNKGFETGFFMGKPLDAWAGVYGSKATTKKVLLGKITNYYEKQGVAEVKIESGNIEKSDRYYIMGPTTGVIEGTMPIIHLDEETVTEAKQGDIITFKSPKCRKNDEFYKVMTAEDVRYYSC